MGFFQSFHQTASGSDYSINDREGILLCQSICTGRTSSKGLVIDVNYDGTVADAADDDYDDYNDGDNPSPTVPQKLRGIFACIRRCMVFGGIQLSVGKLRKVNGRWQYDNPSSPIISRCLGDDDEPYFPNEEHENEQTTNKRTTRSTTNKRTTRSTTNERTTRSSTGGKKAKKQKKTGLRNADDNTQPLTRRFIADLDIGHSSDNVDDIANATGGNGGTGGMEDDNFETEEDATRNSELLEQGIDEDMPDLCFNLCDTSGGELAICESLAQRLFPPLFTEGAPPVTELPQVTPSFLKIAHDMTLLSCYHNQQAVWGNDIDGKLTVLKSGGREVLIENTLGNLFQVKTGVTSHFAFMGLFCSKPDIYANAESSLQPEDPNLENNATFRAVKVLDRWVPESNVTYNADRPCNGIVNAHSYEGRPECRRTSCGKFCERMRPLEATDTAIILNLSIEYCDELGVPVIVMDAGGDAMSSVYRYVLQPECGVIAIGGGHASTWNSIFPREGESGKNGAMLAISRLSNNILPWCCAIDHFFGSIVPESCTKRDITTYSAPDTSIYDAFQNSEETVVIGKWYSETDVERFLVRWSEQGRNGLMAAASIIAGREITDPSEAGQIMLLAAASICAGREISDPSEASQIMNEKKREKKAAREDTVEMELMCGKCMKTKTCTLYPEQVQFVETSKWGAVAKAEGQVTSFRCDGCKKNNCRFYKPADFDTTGMCFVSDKESRLSFSTHKSAKCCKMITKGKNCDKRAQSDGLCGNHYKLLNMKKMDTQGYGKLQMMSS